MIRIEVRNTMEGYKQAVMTDNTTMTLYEDRDKTAWTGDVWDLLRDVIEGEGFNFCYRKNEITDNCLTIWCEDEVMYCEGYQDKEHVLSMTCALVKDDESQYTMEQAVLAFVRNGLLRNIKIVMEDGNELLPAPCKVTFIS